MEKSTDNAVLNRLVLFSKQTQEALLLAIEREDEALALKSKVNLRRTFNEIVRGFYPLSLID